MKKLLFFFTASLFLMLMSCSPQSDFMLIEEAPVQKPETPVTPSGGLVPDIPSDDEADPAPSIVPNVTLPSAAVSGEMRSGVKCVRVDMTGITDLAGGWLTLYETGSSQCNIWITVDDVNDKGLHAINIAAGGGTTAKADISFLIDNSGSMSEEADAVANSITDWANLLVSSGLDVQFSCVGYDGSINGGLDLSSVTDMKTFLERSTGTYRTVGFEGSNASALSSVASNYSTGWGECGVAALRFADENFTFRNGATRVYVNFTDEPNQPEGNSDFSVEYLNPVNALWSASQGTIHSVYSDYDITFTQTLNYEEYPWLMADYTGGTQKFTDSYFTDLTLSDLPVTGALQNSYVIYFTNIDALLDGNTHKVVITISSAEGVQGTLTLYVNFSSLTYI